MSLMTMKLGLKSRTAPMMRSTIKLLLLLKAPRQSRHIIWKLSLLILQFSLNCCIKLVTEWMELTESIHMTFPPLSSVVKLGAKGYCPSLRMAVASILA